MTDMNKNIKKYKFEDSEFGYIQYCLKSIKKDCCPKYLDILPNTNYLSLSEIEDLKYELECIVKEPLGIDLENEMYENRIQNAIIATAVLSILSDVVSRQ